MANVTKLVIQATEEEREFSFRADQTLMAGLEQICNLYPGWKILELPSGTIVMGSQEFVNRYQGNGYYVFQKGSVFKRKTKRSCDAAYTKVRITGKDADGNDLKPVVVPVNNYKQWALPPNKTYHESVPDGFTQAELQAYAELVAESIQYVGVGEDFTGSFQPQLSIGDVAAVDNGDGTSTALGIITSIKHSFGKSGYITDFSTDSGGILMEPLAAAASMITMTKPLNGYNRKQNLKDLIQVASGSSKAGPQNTGTVVKVVSTSNAQTLGGKTYQQIINDAVAKATPVFDLVSAGLPIIPVDGTVVNISTDMSALRSSLNSGQIKAVVQITTGTEVLDATLVLDPLYLPSEDTYQAITLWYYNSSYLRVLFNFTPTEIYARITVEG